jgi:glycosyltransferase involved in cell wall biosynthesis
MTDIKISIIIPAYNRSQHLRGCLDSLLVCRLDGLEAIVVDDGSTDDTAEVVRAYGPPVRYIRQENAGPAVARNTGFAASRGRYVAFLDSDDRWIPGAASRLIEILDRHGDVPLVFGNARMGTPEAGFVGVVETFGRESFPALPGSEVEPGVRRLECRPFFRQLARRNVVFLGSLILRREIVEQAGGFDPPLFGSEDWEFVMRLAVRHEFTYCEDTPVALYIQHPGGISKNHDRMQREFAKALKRILREDGLDPDDRQYVEHQLARHEFGIAYQAYDRGDLEVAREHFVHSFHLRLGLKSLCYWLAAHLPPDVLRRSRALKRGILG